MSARPIRELHYRFASVAGGQRPGHHRSRGGNSGFEFRAHALLQDAPDARRIDLQASLRDPFGNWIVRLHSQRRAIAVAMVADLSASMAFAGSAPKQDVLADFADSLAWAAWRTGDSFAFIGCDERVRPEFLLAPTRGRGAAMALTQSLRAAALQGRSARALREAHRHLPQRRSLVFMLSDFHLPLAELGAALDSLALHDVVPVVLWQASEFALSPRFGLAQVQEPESGRRQWLWWRPALRRRWLAAREARREALLQLFAARRLVPLFIEGAFDADAVTRHFRA